MKEGWPVAVVSSAGEDERKRSRLLMETRQHQLQQGSTVVKKDTSSMKVSVHAQAHAHVHACRQIGMSV